MIRLLFAILLLPFHLLAQEPVTREPDSTVSSGPEWFHVSTAHKRERDVQTQLGWSYVISGGIGLLGGFAGQEIAKDPLEKGAYTLFQTIGIAAVGYGLYKVYIGTEEQRFFSVLESGNLRPEQKEILFRSYQIQKKDLERKENQIRALTHGLIALLNLNNASQQSPGVIRDSLFFIGGVNLLAAASYSFEFE